MGPIGQTPGDECSAEVIVDGEGRHILLCPPGSTSIHPSPQSERWSEIFWREGRLYKFEQTPTLGAAPQPWEIREARPHQLCLRQAPNFDSLGKKGLAFGGSMKEGGEGCQRQAVFE